MNKAFYEFWGHFFLNLARGHEQMETLAALMKPGGSGMNDLAALFRRCYGLETPAATEDESETPAWQQAMADFRRSLNQFAALWGWVPQTVHDRVIQDRDALRQKVADQTAVIGQLRDLLNQEGRGHLVLVEHWKRSLKEQNDQFQALMKSLRDSVDDNG